MENSVRPDPVSALSAIRSLVTSLRGEDGCPWDRKQTPQTIARYLLEEVYELKEAIECDSADAVREELGDVLFHVFFIAHLFEEQGHFDIDDAARCNHVKMTRRHPHVFGDSEAHSDEEIRTQWHRIKQREKQENDDRSILDSIPRTLPVLMRAYRLSERAAGNGFDWKSLRGVMDKVEEEWREFKAELDVLEETPSDLSSLELEFGDLLFTLVNIARFAGFHPENALAAATHKFERRFKRMEKRVVASGGSLAASSSTELNRIWDRVKKNDGGQSFV